MTIGKDFGIVSYTCNHSSQLSNLMLHGSKFFETCPIEDMRSSLFSGMGMASVTVWPTEHNKKGILSPYWLPASTCGFGEPLLIESLQQGHPESSWRANEASGTTHHVLSTCPLNKLPQDLRQTLLLPAVQLQKIRGILKGPEKWSKPSIKQSVSLRSQVEERHPS